MLLATTLASQRTLDISNAAIHCFSTSRTLPHLCTITASNFVSLDRTKTSGSTSSAAALRPCHSSENGMFLLVCSAMYRICPYWRFLRWHRPCYSGPRIERDAKLHSDGLYSFESLQMETCLSPESDVSSDSFEILNHCLSSSNTIPILPI